MKKLLTTEIKVELQSIFGSAGGQPVIFSGEWRVVVIDGESTLYIKGQQATRGGEPTRPMWFSEDNLRVVTTYTNSVAEVTKVTKV